MCIFEMHVNFTSVEAKQLREEAIPIHQQGTHLDLPRYTGKISLQCMSHATFAGVMLSSCVELKWFRFFLFRFYMFLMLKSVFFCIEGWFHSKILTDRRTGRGNHVEMELLADSRRQKSINFEELTKLAQIVSLCVSYSKSTPILMKTPGISFSCR